MAGMQSLKIGVSGVRGIVGQSLTPQLVVGFAEAFGTYLDGGLVVIGRDPRPSGEMVLNALTGGLLSTGCSVIDVGICPTPTMQHAVVDLGADGGIAITASHHPAAWNALKFCREDGVFLNQYQAEELLNVYHQGAFVLRPYDALGRVGVDEGAVNRHLSKVLSSVDREAIAAMAPKVVIDSVNGAGADFAEGLLQKMGCEVIAINDVPNGRFPREPEPLPENLGQLCDAVREHGADIGFAQDADGDRLAIVSAEGEAIGEEFTLAFAADAMAARDAEGPLVTNLSTSRLIEEVAERHGRTLLRTKVGEVNVVERMIATGAVGGGEGNGGVIDPKLHYCRDNLAAMALILQAMAQRDMTVEQWRRQFRTSAIVKDRLDCPAGKTQRVILALRRHYEGREIDLTEGVKVFFDGGAWMHARPSNTEPILRVIAEADDRETARRLCDEALQVAAEAGC
ncbi:MAG: phosphoglucosamine mutase [candidate division WS1 bacterium]|nr:phosphoglucosamine mutase [candidate division WS1 bacterium]